VDTKSKTEQVFGSNKDSFVALIEEPDQTVHRENVKHRFLSLIDNSTNGISYTPKDTSTVRQPDIIEAYANDTCTY
jgi:hypothetical protein